MHYLYAWLQTDRKVMKISIFSIHYEWLGLYRIVKGLNAVYALL